MNAVDLLSLIREQHKEEIALRIAGITETIKKKVAEKYVEEKLKELSENIK